MAKKPSKPTKPESHPEDKPHMEESGKKKKPKGK